MKQGGEKLGSEITNTGWESLTELADQMPEVTRKPEQTEEKLELEPSGEQPLIEKMRATWGDFSAARQLFAEQTEMSPYDYDILAKKLPWEKFVELAEQANQLALNSYDDYQNFLYTKGDELTAGANGLADSRSLALAVRRYNVASNIGEIPPEAKWRVTMSLYEAKRVIHMGDTLRLRQGEVFAINLEESDALAGMREEAKNSGKVNWILNSEAARDDRFDFVAGKPYIGEIRPDITTVVIAENEAGFNVLQKEQQELERQQAKLPASLRKRVKQISVPIWTKQDWYEGVDEERINRDTETLMTTALLKPPREMIAGAVEPYLEQVDRTKVVEFAKNLRKDYDATAREAVNYFAGLVGIENPEKILSIGLLKDDDNKDHDGLLHKGATGLEIRLRKKALRRHPKNGIGVIAHEVFHARQEFLVQHWEKGELTDPAEIHEAELLEFCDRTDSNALINENSYVYYHCLSEKEAFAFGDGVTRKIKSWRRK